LKLVYQIKRGYLEAGVFPEGTLWLIVIKLFRKTILPTFAEQIHNLACCAAALSGG
jgi:hypothetical protein